MIVQNIHENEKETHQQNKQTTQCGLWWTISNNKNKHQCN